MIENKINIKSVIVVFLVIILLIFTMVLYNLNIISFEKKEILGEEIEVTTINPTLPDKVDNIYVDGNTLEIRLKNYISHLGYSISYDIDNFYITNLSDGSFSINGVESLSSIEIVKLNVEEYYQEYERHEKDIYDKSDEIEGHTYYYHFYHGSSIYLKVIIDIDDEYSNNENLARISYMINTLNVS